MNALLADAQVDRVAEQPDEVRVRLREEQPCGLLDVARVEVVSRGRDGLELLKQCRCQLDGGLLPENREGLPALSDLHRQDLADDLQVLAELTDHFSECVGRLKLKGDPRRARIVAGGGDRGAPDLRRRGAA